MAGEIDINDADQLQDLLQTALQSADVVKVDFAKVWFIDSFILNDIFNGLAYYGLGLTYDRGWVGHGGDIPGYNTQLFYHPDLDATVVVEVNSDIGAGA